METDGFENLAAWKHILHRGNITRLPTNHTCIISCVLMRLLPDSRLFHLSILFDASLFTIRAGTIIFFVPYSFLCAVVRAPFILLALNVDTSSNSATYSHVTHFVSVRKCSRWISWKRCSFSLRTREGPISVPSLAPLTRLRIEPLFKSLYHFLLACRRSKAPSRSLGRHLQGQNLKKRIKEVCRLEGLTDRILALSATVFFFLFLSNCTRKQIAVAIPEYKIDSQDHPDLEGENRHAPSTLKIERITINILNLFPGRRRTLHSYLFKNNVMLSRDHNLVAFADL